MAQDVRHRNGETYPLAIGDFDPGVKDYFAAQPLISTVKFRRGAEHMSLSILQGVELFALTVDVDFAAIMDVEIEAHGLRFS